MFKHIGYYSDDDVVALYDATKEEVVNNMLSGLGSFHTLSGLELYTFEEIKNPIGTENDKYLITVSANCSNEDVDENCFIDIFEKI